MSSIPEGKIEATVEVTSELSESLKLELKKKRRKLKEKRAKSSTEEQNFDFEAIQPVPDEESIIKQDAAKMLPKILPKITERQLPLPPLDKISLQDSLYKQRDSVHALRPLPPPRKTKKLYDLKESTSHDQIEEESPVKVPTSTIEDEADKIIELPPEADEIDEYDFFVREWEAEPEPKIVPSENIETDGTSQEDTDSINLIQRELQEKFQIVDIVDHERPSYIPFTLKIEKEKNSFFHPSYKPVPIKMKLPEGAEARSLADEGFFLTKRPKVPTRNVNKLENRLVTQKEFQWFGEDGCMKMLSNPVYQNPIRPMPTDSIDSFPDLEYVKASLSIDKQTLTSQENRTSQLDLDISSISFLHHPLFSTEHVLEARLVQMYEKHLSNVKKDVVNVLKQKLKALRTAVTNLKNTMQKDMQETTVNQERQLRLKQYERDIRQTKRIRDLAEVEQKTLWKSLLNIWEELKDCRKTQRFTSTSLNLTVHEEKLNKSAEKEEFERELLDELEEEMEDYEASSGKLFTEYEEALSKWKQRNKAMKLATKRQEMREKLQSDSQLEDDSEMVEDLMTTKAEDERLLSEPEIPKPKPVPKFNSTTTLEKLRSNAVKMRRNPGEPILHLTVDYDIPITPENQCPRYEVQRRSAVSKQKIYFKIMFNDKKVLETSERNLTQDFKAVWGQIFKIQIVHYPQSLRIEVFEKSFLNSNQLAELYVPIPTLSQTALNAKLVDHQFSSDKVYPPVYNALGSGFSHKFKDGSETFLLTSGTCKCSLVWGVSDDDVVLAPSKLASNINESKKADPLSCLNTENFSDIDKLHKWIKKSNLDPHNPENAALFHFFQELNLEEDNSENSLECFRLEPFKDELEFCSMDEIDNNKRFQLLMLRNRNVAEYQNLKMIPINQEDVTEDMLENLKERSQPNEESREEEGDQLQREQSKKVLMKVREEVAKRFYVSQHQKCLEDIVTEEKVPTIGTIGFSLLKLFQPRRPLCPERKERKKIVCSNTHLDVKIIVRILHASNVPVRKDSRLEKEKNEEKAAETPFNFESQVQPFVEVMFQRMAVKTGIADGPHPTWNQELELPFQAPNDNYLPANLESVKDVIYINLFDEVTVDLLESEKERASIVYERLERRWLGNLKIPFTTLYLNSKIEGTFRLNVPQVLLSYENEPRPWLTGLSNLSGNHTYISFFMTIEPCLQLPEIFRDQFDSAEPEKVLLEVEKWRQSVIPRYPDRLIKLMSVDLSGKWMFVTRFLRSIAPPEELLGYNKESMEAMEMLARFVSLIPTVSDSVTFPGLCDIWSTSEQFLQMMTGDEEEHAILLCNYFLHLGKKAMLLLGSGIPEGPTAYVVMWESSVNILVWNATTGDYFNIRDNHSPLQSVGCLISTDNVWANIQKNNHPSRINFDVNKTSDWKPFFSRSFPNPGLRSIQPTALAYTPADIEASQILQDSLQNILKESIEKWRQKSTTVIWNSNCNKILYKILTRLERNFGRTASDDSLQELEQLLKMYKIDGFPLSMPYTDLDDVVETVFATGVHLNEDQRAEFSVAVYIHAYPSSVLAVWVYVAVLVPHKTLHEESVTSD
ncbi:coiled-coil and C2 domain-containing protein 2A [Parasteatoda tepidariorum]|uniref:coiled-coil and C2 domain-containing protein 2A n=1 Tax=Parasteatoda tepidariorum TaxID=114398 RepID=UPI001C7237D4|nr:coiled-coil and C2 domain-containing protein 2A isoform X2 [Parasteatoda tepidariorum]